MVVEKRVDPSRRMLLGSALVLPWVSIRPSAAQSTLLTPSCDARSVQTLAQTAGPFFTPDSPRRNSLVEKGSTAQRLVLTGLVLSPQCKPIANALLDFWQSDESGAYDNSGFRYRGHVFTDAQGRYDLTTIVPGAYPGRTRHLHVKVQAPRGRVLTTQLYFPGEPQNVSDRIFRSELLMQVVRKPGQSDARFDFIVAT